MVAEELRTAATLFGKYFEKIRQLHRVVAGLVHDDCADRIGLSLVFTRVPQQHRARAKLDSHASQVSERTAAQRTA